MFLKKVFCMLSIVSMSIHTDASTFTVAAVTPGMALAEPRKAMPLRLPSLAESGDKVAQSVAPKKYTKTDVMKALINHAIVNDGSSFTKLFSKLSDEDKKLFANEKFRIPSHNLEGWSLIHVASKNGNLGMVASLVKAGADPNSRTNDHDAIPVMYASANGHTDVVDYLSSLVSPKKTHDYNKALDYAANGGFLATAQKLMDKFPYTKEDVDRASRIAHIKGHEDVALQLSNEDPKARFKPEQERRLAARLAPVDSDAHLRVLQHLDRNENLQSLPNRPLVRHGAVAPLQEHSSALKYMVKEDHHSPKESYLPSRLAPLDGNF